MTTVTEGDPYSRDVGYSVAVDGEVRSISPIGSMNFLDLSVGNYVVELDDVQENCVVAGDNPRNAAVHLNLSTEVPFSITCATLTANMAVKTTSSGAVDPDGYTVTLDGNPPNPLESMKRRSIWAWQPAGMSFSLEEWMAAVPSIARILGYSSYGDGSTLQ